MAPAPREGTEEVLHELNLGDLGHYFNIPMIRVHIDQLEVGDALYDKTGVAHGIVRHIMADFVIVDWYKWDPRIHMPIREWLYFSSGDADGRGPMVWRIEDYPLAMVLDLKNYEKGGHYN